MFQEYPKWIPIDGHEHGGVVVFDAEQEAKARPEKQEDKKPRGRPRKVSNGDQQL